MTATLYAVVLAGGVGSRFWPLSTPDRPKQLLPLVTEESMLAEAIARLVPLVGLERVLVLTSERLRDPVLAALPGLAPEQLLLEPRPAGTAAALTWAATQVVARGGADARMVCVHADWAIGDAERFRETLALAATVAAARSALATVGIVPSRPDPGFGYIQPGEALGDGSRRVARFVEKPDRARAAQMVADGFLWNSGIFAWRAQDLLDEVRALTPELADALAVVPKGASAFFGAVSKGVSIDVGVLERSRRVVVLAGDFDWDDVGTWSALQRVRIKDAHGNASHGRVIARESSGNVVHTEGSTVVLYGVEDLVVVVRDGVTLVTTLDRATDLKPLVEGLPSDLRELRMMALVMYDDRAAREFEPFVLTRPVGELRAGGEVIRRRWTRILGEPATGFLGAAHLARFEEFDAPPASTGTLAAGSWIVNTRCAPVLTATVPAAARVLLVGGRVAAVRLASSTAAAFADGAYTLETHRRDGETASVDGWWLDEVWDLIRHINPMLASDAVALAPTRTEVPAHVSVVGAHDVHVDISAHVEPMVLIDATAGPVLVRRGATVQAFTRLVGPCIIGEDATVSGGRIASCSIGERVKVNGEITASIMLGHCNKGHDGFVGHSVIGRWANLGAGTTTSNLKNSYGTVQLWTPRGVEETGLQFLGSLVGDHVKTGIGTRLTTGCVLGAGANVFGTTMPPKVVAPFAWGEAPNWGAFAIDKFLEVAERVMARRDVPLGPAMRACLAAAHAARWSA